MWYMLIVCAIVGIFAVLGGGCAQNAPVQPVNITASDYCQIAQKVTWSPDDTRQTITEVRRENAKHDSRCRASKPTS
jgi:hypothetical protein